LIVLSPDKQPIRFNVARPISIVIIHNTWFCKVIEVIEVIEDIARGQFYTSRPALCSLLPAKIVVSIQDYTSFGLM
jgi:hypothetical protein